jgi:hypothetical protein
LEEFLTLELIMELTHSQEFGQWELILNFNRKYYEKS